MGVKWSLQAGGISMTGGATQTVMIPAALFREFSRENRSEAWLIDHAKFQASVKQTAQTILTGLSKYL